MKLSVMRRGGKENDAIYFTTMLSHGNPLTSTYFSIIESHLTVINSTLSGNIAQVGNSAGDGGGGSGYGGAIFNLDGTTTLTYVTVANNNALAATSTGGFAGNADGSGVYNPPPPDWLLPAGRPPPALRARYLAGLYPLAHMGPLLRWQATQVGMERTDLWVALTDGGNGLEALAQSHFNRADLVVILDFHHAASYLEDLARAWHAGDEVRAASQAEQWCRLLKNEGGATTLAVLRNTDWPMRRSAALREQWRKVADYFENDLHRMEYPEYVAEGWQIGSGVVESACKTVVGQRLKGARKRWGEAGAHALCHVRALYRSEKGQWEAFWRHRYTQRANVQQLK